MANTSIEITAGMFDSTEITETANGFPIGNKAVTSDFFAKMISTLYTNGVISVNGTTAAFYVTAGTGMYLNCAPGVAWINGYMAWNKEPLRLPVAAGKDYVVCIRLNTADGTITVLCAEDDGNNTYPLRSDTIHDLLLARVQVPLNAVTAETADIEDCRFNPTLCGVVTSAAESVGTTRFAANAGTLGGYSASEYLRRNGGLMWGPIRAAADNTGMSVVRNISYGTTIPDDLAEGDIFILLS